nr:transglutaminase domain-containing protein [uncultured Blautia sp.]
MRKRKPWKIIFIILLVLAISLGVFIYQQQYESSDLLVKVGEGLLDNAPEIFSGEPKEVRDLRKQEVADTEGTSQEYYFGLLNEEEQRGYREIIDGIKARKKEFYLTIYDDDTVNKVYHAVLMDHPELFWVHNRKQVYKTTFSDANYCMFSPGYSYTDEEMQEIQAAAENACQEVSTLLPEGAGDYEKAKTVYTYLIDNAEYQESEDDQSMAGIFWKKQAVCAGYAGAAQYLLEYLGVPCIYVEGSTAGSTEGHAWNIITLNGEYYYFDATNGDQPEFLEGDAVQLAEHKTIIYDYLCPFPAEYEMTYTFSEEFPVPECTATAMNFYVLNQGCFDSYDYQEILAYCQMRLNNGAAVVRFKFSSQEAFDQAKAEWINGDAIQEVARYYMTLYGMSQVEYHYGILENLKTIYYMF